MKNDEFDKKITSFCNSIVGRSVFIAKIADALVNIVNHGITLSNSIANINEILLVHRNLINDLITIQLNSSKASNIDLSLPEKKEKDAKSN